jgi:hypothetical protein
VGFYGLTAVQLWFISAHMNTATQPLRQSVTLTPRMQDALQREHERLGIPVSEIIRRVLDAWVDGWLKTEAEARKERP